MTDWLKKRIWLATAIVVVLALGGVVFGLFQQGFFYTKQEIPFAGEVMSEQIRAEVKTSAYSGAPNSSTILRRTLRIFEQTSSDTPYMAEWYMLAGAVSSQPALRSHIYLCEDQILLARAYIATGNKDSAKRLLDSVYRDFTEISSDGVHSRLRSYLTAEELWISPDAETDSKLDRIPSYSSSSGLGLAYIDVYLRYYEKWGTAADLESILERAAELCPPGSVLSEGLLFEQTTARPLPGNVGEAQEYAEPDVLSFSGSKLAYMNLDTLRALADLSPGYQADYSAAQEVLAAGRISDEVPLYALAYEKESRGYIYYQGDVPSLAIEDSLLVMLSLAKDGTLGADEVRWLKNQLYGMSGITTKYDVLSGQSANSEEFLRAYGLVLQIARYTGDDALFSLAYGKLMMGISTNQDSDAYGIFYQQTDDLRILLRLRDNLEAVVGV